MIFLCPPFLIIDKAKESPVDVSIKINRPTQMGSIQKNKFEKPYFVKITFSVTSNCLKGNQTKFKLISKWDTNIPLYKHWFTNLTSKTSLPKKDWVYNISNIEILISDNRHSKIFQYYGKNGPLKRADSAVREIDFLLYPTFNDDNSVSIKNEIMLFEAH